MLVSPISLGCKSFITPGDTTASLVSEDPIDLQLGLAQRAERSGELVNARAAYRAILEEQPENVTALHRLGVVSVRLEQLPEAIEYLEEAAKLETPSSDLLGDLGYAHFLNGDLETARSTFDRALLLDPIDKRLMNNQGLVLGYLGEEEASLELFRRAGSEAEALSNLGFVYAQLGDVPKAKQHYLRALDLQPDMKNAAQALVDLHEAEKRARQTTNDVLESQRLPQALPLDSDSESP